MCHICGVETPKLTSDDRQPREDHQPASQLGTLCLHKHDRETVELDCCGHGFSEGEKNPLRCFWLRARGLVLERPQDMQPADAPSTSSKVEDPDKADRRQPTAMQPADAPLLRDPLCLFRTGRVAIASSNFATSACSLARPPHGPARTAVDAAAREQSAQPRPCSVHNHCPKDMHRERIP